jgi:hypothetical protein
VEHQKSDWSNHSKHCKSLSGASTKASSSVSTWNPPKVIVPAKGAKPLDTFRAWLLENDVKGLDKLDVAEFESSGRGLKATGEIKADQVVLEVPRKLLLTLSDSVRSHPELVKVFSDVTVWTVVSQLPDVILAIRLLFEKHSALNSPWMPWINVLPKKYNSTLFWPNRELALLEGSNLYQMTKLHKQQLEAEYSTVFKQTLAKRFPLIFKPSQYSLDEFFWAMATIYSRATDGVVDGGEQRYLVPMMDMANHSFEAVTKHGFDAKSNSFRITSTGDIAADSQMYINYGPLGNAKLLHVYGFTVPNNPYDYVQLFLAMDPNAEIYEEKKKLLAARGIEPSPNFYLRLDDLDRFPIDILGTVRIQRLLEHDLDRAEYAFHPDHIISEENEVHSLKALEEGLKAMFLAYPTPYDQDLELAEAVNKGEKKPSPNELNALLIRMGDRLVIGKAGGCIAEMTEMIRAHLQAKIDSGDTTPLVPNM